MSSSIKVAPFTRRLNSLSGIQNAILALALSFIFSRLVIVGVAYTGYTLFHVVPTDASLSHLIKEMWSRWDVGWYRLIAFEGYEQGSFSAESYKKWGFLPLYPFLVKAVLWLFNTNKFFWVGSILSSLLTFSALLILSNSFKDRIQNASRFFLLYLISAGSFHLSLPYSESLALFFLACTFYFTKKKNYFLAALLAGLGAVTRIQMLALLVIPFIPVFLDFEKKISRNIFNSFVVLVLFSIPTLIHMGYLNYLSGNPFAYFDMQEAWGNKNPYPLESLVVFLSKGLQNAPRDWLHFFIWATFGACLIRNYKKIPLNEIVFCTIIFLISTGCEIFYGANRYVLLLIPLYITLTNEDEWFRNLYIYSNLVIGCLYIIAFTNDKILAL